MKTLLLVASLAALPLRAPAAEPLPCADVRAAALKALHAQSPTGTRPVSGRLDHAFVLFRLGRKQEAQAAIDYALTLLDRTRARLMNDEERESVQAAVRDFRRCIRASTAPPLAKLTIRTYEQDDTVADGRGGPAAAGAVVRIDETPVGRTRRGGVFTGLVPSGPLIVSVEIQPNEAGRADLDLAPASTRVVSIRVDSSKEVTEETPVVVAEAKGGLLPAASRTLTLQFIAPSGPVRISSTDEVVLLGPLEDIEHDLTSLFIVRSGAIVAVDPPKVIALLRARDRSSIVLRVEGTDAQGIIHSSRVELRVE